MRGLHFPRLAMPSTDCDLQREPPFPREVDAFVFFFGYTVYQIEFCLGSEKPVLIYKLSILRASGDRRLPEPFHLQHQTLPPDENSTAVQAMKKKLFILTPASQ